MAGGVVEPSIMLLRTAKAEQRTKQNKFSLHAAFRGEVIHEEMREAGASRTSWEYKRREAHIGVRQLA